ncbi:hypothetical protein [Tsuneonella sp. SYSU-LHT278]|uniref:hypothetical protein n=1 Tax=Tsuneonella sediminis TaxID=3416089 RepID=UPI003F78E079
MGPLLVILAQAGAASTAEASPSPPDIEIRATASARSVDLRSAGQATLSVHARPGDAPPVRIARSAPAGAARYRDLRIELTAIARLSAPEPIAAIHGKTGDSE